MKTSEEIEGRRTIKQQSGVRTEEVERSKLESYLKRSSEGTASTIRKFGLSQRLRSKRGAGKIYGTRKRVAYNTL